MNHRIVAVFLCPIVKSLLISLIALAGCRTVAAWQVTNNFDDGSVGTTISSKFMTAASDTKYSNAHVDSGNSLSMTVIQGEDGYGKWGGIVNFPSSLKKGDELWVSFAIYLPADFYIYTPTNGSLKFIRVRTKAGDGFTSRGYNDFQIVDDNDSETYQFRQIKEGKGMHWTYFGSRKDNILSRGKWHKIEAYIRFSDDLVAQNGALTRFWVDGKLLSEVTDQYTIETPDDTATNLLLFTYWNGKAPKTQTLWIDDFVMTDEPPTTCDTAGNRSLSSRVSCTGEESSPPMAPKLDVM